MNRSDVPAAAPGDPVGGAAAGVERRRSGARAATRSSPRDHLPRSNSIFNSAVVPFRDGYAGVFRVDDTRRTMNLHAGRSADGVDWEIDEEPIAFEPADDRVARDPGGRSSTPTTRA